MSSRKTATAKRSSAAAKSGEPSRAEKAAFVKAMLHGIKPGTEAAKKTADKRAGIKNAPAAKPSAKKVAAKKAGSKPAKKAAAKTTSRSVAEAEQPKVEILRKISAPPKVKSTPKSAEVLKLAKEIEKAIENGDLDFVQPHAVQALMMSLCKFYAANDEADNVYPILPGRLAVSGTDAMVVCGALLRAVDLQVFELGMFQSWSGR